ncbi:MAG: hypothetical protein ACYC3I_01565 [Gemmataceae bacterium]
MRRMRQGLMLTLTMTMALLGCAQRNIVPRKPKHPEELIVPPLADLRFSSPPHYPEPVNPNYDSDRPQGALSGQPNLGAMNMGGMGMGGMGMGGMGMGGMQGGYGGGMGMGR